MRIKKVKLINYCQHKNLEIDLTGNVIGIVGRNGSGKSNFVSAINYCITGEFERKKDRLISLGETTGSIEVEVEINASLTIKIFRSLKGNKAEMTFSDNRPSISGADLVNETILELIGVDKTTLKNIVFVGQDELGALLYSRDSERERLAQQFFGIDRAVRIEKILGDKYNKTVIPELRGDPLQISSEIESKRISLDIHNRTLEDKKSKFDSSKLDELIALSSQINKYSSIINSRASIQSKISNLESEVSEINQKLSLKKSECDGLSIDAVKSKLSSEIQKSSQYDLYTSTKQALEQAESAYNQLLESEPPCSQLFIDQLDSQISKAEKVGSDISFKMGLRLDILKNLEKHPHTDCPICFSELDATCTLEIKNAADADMSDMDTVSNLSELRLRRKNWQQSLQKHEADIRFMLSRVEDLKNSDVLKSIPEKGNIEKWQKNLSFVESLFNEVRNLENLITEKESTLNQAKAELNNIPAPASLPDNLQDISSIISEIEQLQLTRSEIQSTTSAIELLESQIGYEQKQLDLALSTCNEIKRATSIRNSLSKIRSVFHPDGAPRDLVTRRVERMESKINEYLGLLGVCFTIKGVGGFNFEAIFPDKPHPIKITELSGGQKIDLSLAFRFAACESFSSSAGLLVLDEPSVYLDEDTKQHLVEVFERLKDMAEQMRMQFLVVTHEKSLLGCFDQTVQFGTIV